MWRVLVFPGGTEIGIEICRSLQHCKEVQLFSAGITEHSHAPFFFRNHFEAPIAGTSGWLERVQQIVKDQHITHIFPAHDEVIQLLLQFEENISAKVVTSSESTCSIARSKKATYAALAGVIPVPTVFETPAEVHLYPVFVKPDRGQGSRGAKIARTEVELEIDLADDPTRIISEYLPGREYTVDCFSDRENGVLLAEGRLRARVTNGISSSAHLEKNAKFMDLARKIQSVAPFYGAWFFQLKEDKDGALKLLEMAPRCAGTSALTRVCGANLPLLSLYECERIQVTAAILLDGIKIDRSLTPSYNHQILFDTLYLDLDDTLIINGKVNTILIRLLYQCINQEIAIVLITKHRGNLSETLAKYRLAHLFDRVVHLAENEEKRDAILPGNSVFIDDSYSELTRASVLEGVTVIHPSAAEILLKNYE
jgi:carbamoyl-phosphate synthase large subunit